MIHIFIIISILSISEIHIIHRICNGDLFGDMVNHMFGFLWKWGILCVDDTFGGPPTSYDLVGALEHVFFHSVGNLGPQKIYANIWSCIEKSTFLHVYLTLW